MTVAPFIASLTRKFTRDSAADEANPLNPRRSALRKRRPCSPALMEGLEVRTLLSSYAFNVITSFSIANGNGPRCTPVLDASGDLIGTTEFGGAAGDGTVFEIAHGTSTITALVSFSAATGINPRAGVILDSAGDLFGTTFDGGAYSQGTIFEIGIHTTNITTLASFAGTDGAYPQAGLIMDAQGDLFGTTTKGGGAGDGTVFELPYLSGAITTLGTFTGANGSSPTGGVTLDAAGNLFGTTSTGGANGLTYGGYGTAYEIAHGTAVVTTLASFAGYDGLAPEGNLALDSSGNLYGAASGGSLGDGTLFEIAPSTRAITTLASFNGINGNSPEAGVIRDAAGNLFGTTYQGGTGSEGTVFELAGGSGVISTMVSFNMTNGSYPRGDLAVDSSGDLFGTTDAGGAGAVGNVFEFVATPSATVSGTVYLHSRKKRKPTLGGVTLLLQEVGKRGRLKRGGMSTTTGSDGTFTFNGITAGNYRLSEVVPAGDTLQSPVAGFYSLTLSGSQVVTGMDFID